MARRIEIELTSKRDDGTWTWRAAGAREPKGTLDGAIVPPATQVGDVVRVEVEGFLDGVSVVGVVPPKAPRSEPDRIDLLTPRSEGPMVTTRLARSSRRERPRRDERGDRGDRRRGRTDRGERGERGPRSDRDGGDRDRGRDRGERGERHPAPPPVEAKPKPKRLRPAKVHRSALLEALPAEQRPIAEQLLQGGIPAVRQAIEKQNDELKTAGKSQVAAEPLLEIAERLRHRAQAAAWRDRADAALAQVDDLDLRDLRSVVNAADDGGRDQAAREVATSLREALLQRVEKEHVAWVEEVSENLRDGRVVRALRLSSRPPKAGSPLPPDISAQLIADTTAALTSETGSQRWATILDALAFSPIRRRVVPESLPDKLSADLRTTIARLGTRLPEIAHIFAITPEEAPARPPRQGNRGKGAKGGAGPRSGDQSDAKPKSRNKRRADKPPRSTPKPGEPADTKPADATTQPAGSEIAPTEPASDETIAANAAGTEPAIDATPAGAGDEPSTPAEPDGDPTETTSAAGTVTPSSDADDPGTEPAAATTTADEAPADDAAVPEPAGGEPPEPTVDEAPAPEAAAASDDEAPDAEPGGGEPTELTVEEETSAAAAPATPDETPAAEAGPETGATEAPNGTVQANGEHTAEADSDDNVRVDS